MKIAICSGPPTTGKTSVLRHAIRKLIDKGVAHCAKKLGEEAVETIIAAMQKERGE